MHEGPESICSSGALLASYTTLMPGIRRTNKLDCSDPKRPSKPTSGFDAATESPVSNISFSAVRQELPGRVSGRLCSLRALRTSASGLRQEELGIPLSPKLHLQEAQLS